MAPKRGTIRNVGDSDGQTAERRTRVLERTGRLDILRTEGPTDYALIDSGDGRKLERFGPVVVDRPEPQALWRRQCGADVWSRAHAVFSASAEDEEKGKWRLDKPVPERWPVSVGDAVVTCRLQGLWHVGLFPEQVPHWDWMLERIGRVEGERPRVLNLFAYTGAASLVAARAGAEVTHVDASKKAIQWAKENQTVSGLSEAPIRWILDDAAKFVAREVRRGRTYHVILIDPPKFGRGPEGEVWDLFQGLPPLMRNVARLLANETSALVLTVYAIRASALAFEQLAADVLADCGGQLSAGELALVAEGGGAAVPTSLFVRWTS
ncbi:class I SAM-dependent methyltransferase [Hyphomicrobium sp.]|uniref:class I SAM-dependent methyltransferase n=1 Tax=Hyphomicrobium sp. TaxID=82 RepID=UPI0025C25DC5|nr:class I SAM-dependent methyltransferase [Hyphomicrobium sp.]MCC7252950.1 class I SAM-dependent methyltransferase [Hyphomicrobium sp.]